MYRLVTSSVNGKKAANKPALDECFRQGFRRPFKVFIDASMVYNMVSDGRDVPSSLTEAVGKCYAKLTSCAHKDFRRQRIQCKETARVLKNLEKYSCNHEPKISVAECFKSVLKNMRRNRRYLVASDDMEVLEALKEVPNVPVLQHRFRNEDLILDPPQQKKEEVEGKKKKPEVEGKKRKKPEVEGKKRKKPEEVKRKKK